MPEISDDAWIDLSSLIECATETNGLLEIHYQYNNPNSTRQYDSSVLYNLRKALRAVGHKITKIENHTDNDCRTVMITFYTTVTEAEHTRMSSLWNAWIINIETEYDVGDSDSEGESEDEEENQEQNDEPQ